MGQQTLPPPKQITTKKFDFAFTSTPCECASRWGLDCLAKDCPQKNQYSQIIQRIKYSLQQVSGNATTPLLKPSAFSQFTLPSHIEFIPDVLLATFGHYDVDSLTLEGEFRLAIKLAQSLTCIRCFAHLSQVLGSGTFKIAQRNSSVIWECPFCKEEMCAICNRPQKVCSAEPYEHCQWVRKSLSNPDSLARCEETHIVGYRLASVLLPLSTNPQLLRHLCDWRFPKLQQEFFSSSLHIPWEYVPQFLILFRACAGTHKRIEFATLAALSRAHHHEQLLRICRFCK